MLLLCIFWGGIVVFILWLIICWFERSHKIKIVHLLSANKRTKRELEDIQSRMGLTTSYAFNASDIHETIDEYFKQYNIIKKYMSLTYIHPDNRIFYIARHIIIIACKDTMYIRACGKDTFQTSTFSLEGICNLYLSCGEELLNNKLIDKSQYIDMMDYVKQIKELKYGSLY